jgi:hypothetical protein
VGLTIKPDRPIVSPGLPGVPEPRPRVDPAHVRPLAAGLRLADDSLGRDRELPGRRAADEDRVEVAPGQRVGPRPVLPHEGGRVAQRPHHRPPAAEQGERGGRVGDDVGAGDEPAPGDATVSLQREQEPARVEAGRGEGVVVAGPLRRPHAVAAPRADELADAQRPAVVRPGRGRPGSENHHPSLPCLNPPAAADLAGQAAEGNAAPGERELAPAGRVRMWVVMTPTPASRPGLPAAGRRPRSRRT